MSDRVELLRPAVERTVREYLGAGDELHVEPNGDIPVRVGSALFRVTLLDHDPVLVRVWSIVLRGVPRTPELLEELNDINRGVLSARVYAFDDAVVAATEIAAETMDLGELAFACDSVGVLADWVDTTLAVRFGGEKTFADED